MESDYKIIKEKRELKETESVFEVRVTHKGESKDFSTLFDLRPYKPRKLNTKYAISLKKSRTSSRFVETTKRRSIKHQKAENRLVKKFIINALKELGWEYLKTNQKFTSGPQFFIRGIYSRLSSNWAQIYRVRWYGDDFPQTINITISISHDGVLEVSNHLASLHDPKSKKGRRIFQFSISIKLADPACKEKLKRLFLEYTSIRKFMWSYRGYSSKPFSYYSKLEKLIKQAEDKIGGTRDD